MTLSEDFKKPINIIFLILAIAGLASGFYFYKASQKTKSISYHIDEPSSLIYDSNNSSSAIKVLEKDSIPIKDNVYLLTGVIWNSGDLPILREDVRQSLSINLSSAKKILDFKIIKQTDPSIANFNLIKNSNNSLVLKWKYFDPGYAFKFQIIYTGFDKAQFILDGRVLDIKQFNRFPYLGNEINPKPIFVILIAVSSFLLWFISRLNKANNTFIIRLKNYLIAKENIGITMITLKTMAITFLLLGIYSLINLVLTLVDLYNYLNTNIPFR
jgi:hypothetical protein